VIRDSSKQLFIYIRFANNASTYSSNSHLSFNIRVNSLAERFFLTKSKDANHHESHIV